MSKRAVIKEWVESIIIAVILAMVIRTFVVQAFKIPTGSMRPTLLEGDRILVNKFIYGAKIPFTNYRLPGFKEPQPGEVIVFIYPQDPKRDFIKRLVAKENQEVLIEGGTIYIDGNPLKGEVFNKIYYYNRGDYAIEDSAIKVVQGSYYVLGDNSASSRDSRYWGFVPQDNVLGKAFLIYWPLHRIRIIK